MQDSESSSDSGAESSSESAYMTIPEVFEYVHKVSETDAYPKTFAEAMTRPDAQMYYQAAVDEIDVRMVELGWTQMRKHR